MQSLVGISHWKPQEMSPHLQDQRPSLHSQVQNTARWSPLCHWNSELPVTVPFKNNKVAVSYEFFAAAYLRIPFFWEMMLHQQVIWSPIWGNVLSSPECPQRHFCHISTSKDDETILPRNTVIWLSTDIISYPRKMEPSEKLFYLVINACIS
jgi:hypothetical protein